MKVSQEKLNELIRHITNAVLKEYSSLSPSGGDDSDDGDSSNGDKPVDAMTDSEKRVAASKQKIVAKKELDRTKDAAKAGELDAMANKKKSENFFRNDKRQFEKDIRDQTKALASTSTVSTPSV